MTENISPDPSSSGKEQPSEIKAMDEALSPAFKHYYALPPNSTFVKWFSDQFGVDTETAQKMATLFMKTEMDMFQETIQQSMRRFKEEMQREKRELEGN